MLAKIKSFLKTTAIYGVVGSTRSFIEFLLLPVYARFLSPADFGVLDILMIYAMVGLVVSVMEMNNAAFRFYFDRKDNRSQSRVISNAFVLSSVNGAIIFIITMVFAGSFSTYFFNSTDHSQILVMVGAYIMLSSIATVPANLLRILNKPVQYVRVSVAQIILTIAAVVVFVAYFKLGVMGVIAAKTIAVIPTIAICLYWARSHINLKLNPKLMLGMLKYALPLIPAGMAIWGINSLNRLFMIQYLSLDQIGLFSLASKFVVVITLTVVAFQLAWPQFAFSNMNSKEAAKTFSQIFNISAALGFWLVLSITLFSSTFIKIAMNESFAKSAEVVLPLALGMLLYGVYYFFTTGAVIAKKTMSVLFPLALAVCVNVILNLIITPIYGFIGTGWVTFVSYLVMASSMYYLVRKSTYIRLEFKRLLKLLIPSAIALAAGYSLIGYDSLWFVLLKLGILALFPPTLLLFGFIRNHHVDYLKQAVHGLSRSKITFRRKADEKAEYIKGQNRNLSNEREIEQLVK